MGYLYLESRSDYPGLVRVLTATTEPQAPFDRDGSHIEYIARFDDESAAMMHLHQALHRHLVDINSHSYTVPMAQAVAAVEADDLRHQRIWIAPQLATDSLEWIEADAERRRQRQTWRTRIWQWIGWLAILLLLLLGRVPGL